MIRRRRHRKDHTLLWLLGATCVAFGLVLALQVLRWQRRESTSLAPPDVHPVSEPLAVRGAAMEEGNGRPVYRHSVIRGGAYSVAEVERALRQDPVVNSHYAVFDKAKLRMAEAPAARSVYVSYRIGEEVYWTKNRVRVAAGEILISDGKHEARARCGNRISETAQEPAGTDERWTGELNVAERSDMRQPGSPQPSALVVDVFNPTPLIPQTPSVATTVGAHSGSENSGAPFFASSPIGGGGIGLGMWPGAPGAPNASSPPGPPAGDGAPGIPGLSWLLPGTAAGIAPLPDPWYPSPNQSQEPPRWSERPAPGRSFGFPETAGSQPPTSTSGVMPPPGSGDHPTGPNMPHGDGDPGSSTTGETPGTDGPPSVPVIPLLDNPNTPERPFSPVPEPGTAILSITGLALVAAARRELQRASVKKPRTSI